MIRCVMAVAVLLSLAGCGLAGTGAAAAAGGVSKAEEVKQAKETEARIKQQIDSAYSQASQQRRDADAAAQ